MMNIVPTGFGLTEPTLLTASSSTTSPPKQYTTNYTALLTGHSWVLPEGLKKTKTPVFITYSFPSHISEEDRKSEPENANTWHKFSEQDRLDARAALKQWGNACGITFLEVGNNRGDIQFNWIYTGYDNSAIGYHPDAYAPFDKQYYTYFYPYGGDVYMNTGYMDRFKEDKAFKTYILLHEIGHTLGFKHTFDSSYPMNHKILAKSFDTTDYSVMSYTYDAPPTKLGPFDIKAARALYGSPRMDGKQASHWAWSKKNETLTQIGKMGADTLNGTGVKDIIKGGAGNDVIRGLAGNDTLHGGDGDDMLIGGPGHDVFVFDSALENSVVGDIIYDFDAKEDKIYLSQQIFQALSSEGDLAADAFVVGNKAQDQSDRIVYDGGHSGDLFYDPDGTGPLAQIKFAQFGVVSSYFASIKAGHFIIV